MNSFDFELYRKMAQAIQNIRMMESFRPELEFHKQMQNAGLTPAVLQEIAELNWREELATAAGVHQPHVISPALPVPFQYRVQPWMMATFGTEIAADTAERNHRFLEESLELVQACGCTASEAHQLVDYVFNRPVGDPAQEVGGVMVTLAALCLAQGQDMHDAGETELARIWTKVEAIRAKQADKPRHSPLPQAWQPDCASDTAGWRLCSYRWPDGPGKFYYQDAADPVGAEALKKATRLYAASSTAAEMRALCSACGGTGDVHSIDGEWRGQCTCVHAWRQRAEKAEADLKQVNEWRAAALAENVQSGERWAKRVADLEAQLVRRSTRLSPETQQAIAAARAAGQSIAATPAGLVFINDGAEPNATELDCPVCGGSGHAGDVKTGSAP